MMESFDIQDADSIHTLIHICKTDLKMNQAIEDLLWDFCDDFGIDLSTEKMDIMIENIIKTAMSRY